ncbi:response regulator [Owenweeksia hongkongensis]|uniref:response regulator n=1 Tax=Owenweeksia hongkongensis TaxID=253245 RepID=UPI003A946523
MGEKVGMVCVIDDDNVYRFTTEKYIQMLNLPIKVVSFGDGEMALEYLKNNSNQADNLPDIMFLDVNMPVMDGWDFLDEYEDLRNSLIKEIKIYLVSSSTDERDHNRSMKYAYVEDYIVKPITEEYLERLIKR